MKTVSWEEAKAVLRAGGKARADWWPQNQFFKGPVENGRVTDEHGAAFILELQHQRDGWIILDDPREKGEENVWKGKYQGAEIVISCKGENNKAEEIIRWLQTGYKMDDWDQEKWEKRYLHGEWERSCRVCGGYGGHEEGCPGDKGKTLRDEFAMAALAGLLADGSRYDVEAEAYERADLMLKARKK